ncbi:MAG: GNAT family N-acetyltransferase [Flavobacteriales bacterium]|jgi:diamine N-acetyltransferase|nr:GNAT family N-acetyltransferase [Flavobacteriaceae bacterium]MDO7582430.1 GNAT family N-acetyltransferase [Flavobacteriaceae bacterium]MDO7591183.1 GNAT family N-acetyltransferase [Flavobacteriaceae bacterium]MDO7598748.1 GNAT family N-acetyltransferase [Flavobacteriaceae bacterium]MDO7602666.1 GNAT family N-acetyltransferase [Flavobacteriaceae bacterium]|tara:strand:+ start:116 stop:541 length:426 start_codon:yes stop_codon:yes gene_type:complete
MDIHFQIIQKEFISEIIPLIQEFTDNKFPNDILEIRFNEMFTQNYECIGVFKGDMLIGLCGLWFQTRHYAGKSCEPDHVYIQPEYQGLGLGNKMFDYVERYCKEKGCESLELNTYVQNTSSHKFYYNLGYKILGYHFFKDL